MSIFLIQQVFSHRLIVFLPSGCSDRGCSKAVEQLTPAPKPREVVGSNPAKHWNLFLSFLTFHRNKVIECQYLGPSRTCFVINCCER